MNLERETRSDMYWIYPGSSGSLGRPDASGVNLSTNTWYKYEFFVNGTNSKARLYDDSETLIVEQTKSVSQDAFTNDNINFSQAVSNWSYHIDEIKVEIT